MTTTTTTTTTATDAQLWNLSRHAVNDTTRAIARAGIVLTHDQADELGEEVIDWARRELDLHVTTTDEHVILCSWAVGDRVEGGEPGTEDHDTGRVIEVDGTRVHVAWDTLVTAWHGADELRPWADRS